MLLKLSGNKIGQAGQVKAISGQGRTKVDSGRFGQIRISRLGKACP